jgi:hypothetical protein
LSGRLSEEFLLPRLDVRSLGLVVGAFVASVMGTGVFIMAAGTSDGTAAIIEMLKVFFLPLVTLVLGHYFGSKAE